MYNLTVSADHAENENWARIIDQLELQAKTIESWTSELSDPEAERCALSRHRTLAHLRACQETWLEAVQLFAAKDNVSINRPHPWRLFRDNNYHLIEWNEHLAKYLADRQEWLNLVANWELDLSRGGRISRKSRTIASLTEILANHEKHHLDQLEQAESRMRKKQRHSL